MTSSSFYRRSVIAVGGMAIALFMNSQASAQTYDGTLTIDGLTSTYSITTDGTLGALTGSNIASWGVTMSSTAGVVTFTNGPGSLVFSGSSLSATTTDLLFNYGVSGVNYLIFCSFNCRHFLDFETNDGFADNAAMRFDNGTIVRVGQTSIQSIASRPGTIGAVPEPGTWAMMLLGFGAIGFSMRRRRKAVGTAQLA